MPTPHNAPKPNELELGTLRAEFEGKVYDVRVCYPQQQCDRLMAQFPGGVLTAEAKGPTKLENAWFMNVLKRLASRGQRASGPKDTRNYAQKVVETVRAERAAKVKRSA